jgi:putative transposase
MPWSINSVEKQRWCFVKEALRAGPLGFAGVCRKFGISRKSGYKWMKRVAQLGCTGLADRPRSPRRQGRAFDAGWSREVLEVHVKNYRVGARKVRALLRERYPGIHLPAERTVHRWLRAVAAVQPMRPLGPPVPSVATRGKRRPNDVWTLDFKGWFYTGDGQRVQVFTVRDLASRMVLASCHLKRTNERSVARCLTQLFGQYGLPRAIRVDQGAPFCGDGPRRWSKLSVRWIRLGIAVQITRRAKPQDNGAHEQMHRVLKANTATPPAPTLSAQRRRLDRWRHWYNCQRPHQSLNQRQPATRYRCSPRPLRPMAPLTYPLHWTVRRVDLRGYIFWRGQRWQIGRAFYRQPIGLRPRRTGFGVYLGSYLLGELSPNDHLIRPVRFCPNPPSK